MRSQAGQALPADSADYSVYQEFFPLIPSPPNGISANLRMVFIINPFVVIRSEAKNLQNYRHVREILHCAALRSE